MSEFKPRNRTARAAHRVIGNPASAGLDASVGNCFPGLEIDVRNLEIEVERFYRAAAMTDELVGLRNAVRVALIVTLAAWANHESRGCHYRE